jgi:DNA-binding transcriptional MerR regulator
MTIDELARRTGMTVRNIRAHQSRGLLPPPEVRGRTGFYGSEHVDRIELIKELQADGFNLEAIRRLIDSAGGSTKEVLRFTRAARESFEEEKPRVVTLRQLAERTGNRNAALLERAIELGIYHRISEDQLEERSPRLSRAAGELGRLGMSDARALEVLEALHAHADGVARAYVDLFVEEVWRPFEEAGHPPERWPEVEEALRRLTPLAAESLVATFRLVMSDRVDEAVGQELFARLSDGSLTEQAG